MSLSQADNLLSACMQGPGSVHNETQIVCFHFLYCINYDRT